MYLFVRNSYQAEECIKPSNPRFDPLLTQPALQREWDEPSLFKIWGKNGVYDKNLHCFVWLTFLP